MPNSHDSEKYQDNLVQSQQYWDQHASTFDDEADHGLRDPLVRETWTGFLQAHLPATRADVLDIGCGTGSLSVVLAGLGQRVTGIDLSPAMISLAQAKAASLQLEIEFKLMDGAFPQLPGRRFDVILCRHLLWALPEPAQVLQRWAAMLQPRGCLVLIEGHWGTGAGLHASEITAMLAPGFATWLVYNLSDNPNFWGKPVSDERFAVIANML